MVIPVKKFDSIFYRSLSMFFEDRNKEYLLTKVKQFSKFGFGEICTQMFNNISIYMKLVSINYIKRDIVDNKTVLKKCKAFVF